MKYYLFLDECGDQNLSNFSPDFPIFTLCGVIVSDDQYQNIKSQVNALKTNFWQDKKVVLHSRDIRKCQNGFEILNNTKPYLEKGCRDFDVEVIDTHAIAGSIDGIHMDESGHKQVADVLISVIQEL